MSDQQDLPLRPSGTPGAVVINARCMLRSDGERRVVVVAGLPVHPYSANDAVAEAYAMVFLVDGGFATQLEVARAFGCSERTVRRHQERYADSGMTALATRSGWRPGCRRIPTKRRLLIERMKTEGLSNREIARRLGVTENAIRKQVPGRSESPSGQQPLPLSPTSDPPGTHHQPAPSSRQETSATSSAPPPAATAPIETEQTIRPAEDRDESLEPVALSLDNDPTDRSLDRLLAAFGYLDDAAPVFGDANAVDGAGVLFALPVLVGSGVFQVAYKLYGPIGPAFYGLRTTLLTLLLMALWRIKRPEALKEYDPQTLGRIIGLDRAPEVKTVRRKLTRLAAYHRAERLGAELGRSWLSCGSNSAASS
jgi:transposase